MARLRISAPETRASVLTTPTAAGAIPTSSEEPMPDGSVGRSCRDRSGETCSPESLQGLSNSQIPFPLLDCALDVIQVGLQHPQPTAKGRHAAAQLIQCDKFSLVRSHQSGTGSFQAIHTTTSLASRVLAEPSGCLPLAGGDGAAQGLGSALHVLGDHVHAGQVVEQAAGLGGAGQRGGRPGHARDTGGEIGAGHAQGAVTREAAVLACSDSRRAARSVRLGRFRTSCRGGRRSRRRAPSGDRAGSGRGDH